MMTQLNRDNTLAALGRYMLIVPALGVSMATFVVVAAAYIWWMVIGWPSRLLLGKTVGVWIGRYVGCYPFVFILIFWAAIVAVFLWAGGRKQYRTAYGELTGNMLDEISKYKAFRQIGGLW